MTNDKFRWTIHDALSLSYNHFVKIDLQRKDTLKFLHRSGIHLRRTPDSE